MPCSLGSRAGLSAAWVSLGRHSGAARIPCCVRQSLRRKDHIKVEPFGDVNMASTALQAERGGRRRMQNHVALPFARYLADHLAQLPASRSAHMTPSGRGVAQRARGGVASQISRGRRGDGSRILGTVTTRVRLGHLSAEGPLLAQIASIRLLGGRGRGLR